MTEQRRAVQLRLKALFVFLFEKTQTPLKQERFALRAEADGTQTNILFKQNISVVKSNKAFFLIFVIFIKKSENFYEY